MRKPASIALWWYAKTPQGWRHFPCVWEKQYGIVQPKHGWVRYKGEQIEYAEGRYELRSWEGGRRVYKALATAHPLEAVRALNRAKREASGTVRSNLHLIGPAIDAYVHDLGKQRKSEMSEKARNVLGEFKTFNPHIVGVISMSRDTILRFHAQLRAKGNSERTIADKHQRVKAWLRWCKVDASFMPPAPKYEETLPTIYEPEEVRAIRRAAFDAGDVQMLLCIDMALKLGLREQEVEYAEWADLRFSSREFRVQGKIRKDWRFAVKDKEQRDVPVPVDLLQSLLSWHGQHPDSVLIIGNKRGLPEGHLLRKLKALARNAKLNCGRCEGCQRKGSLAECEEWTLHRFRRTYVTGLLRNGMDARTVQQFAGHSDLETTLRYLRPASAAQSQDLVNSIRWDDSTGSRGVLTESRTTIGGSPIDRLRREDAPRVAKAWTPRASGAVARSHLKSLFVLLCAGGALTCHRKTTEGKIASTTVFPAPASHKRNTSLPVLRCSCIHLHSAEDTPAQWL